MKSSWEIRAIGISRSNSETCEACRSTQKEGEESKIEMEKNRIKDTWPGAGFPPGEDADRPMVTPTNPTSRPTESEREHKDLVRCHKP